MSEAYEKLEEGEYADGFRDGFKMGFREASKDDGEILYEGRFLTSMDYFYWRCESLFEEIAVILKKNEEMRENEKRK